MKYCLSFTYKLIAVFAAMSLLIACQQKTDSDLSQDVSQPQADAPFRAGAHGSYDPHSKLTAEKHIQVALKHRDEGRMG